ncbi:hypothetical protein PUNSTDRAFT_138582 [Punctularia strigosozonata HHB-11173 SS5]|uniref:Uncharacterized protein n=1 Tax=Punctularia strigosozonata (strain HHB-11173) TaxID=741275 RepID=R7S2B3_PUNST|nr:uncharacterized protein PUNSTDRAFT_138582 [Punctularia strigosozonata HHB-11173 SS5]EIN04540.1 hypothetical protein PUNSTDRAFT_138582 [Punctularia strigosozonata HHB-11173 SS5]
MSYTRCPFLVDSQHPQGSADPGLVKNYARWLLMPHTVHGIQNSEARTVQHSVEVGSGVNEDVAAAGGLPVSSSMPKRWNAVQIRSFVDQYRSDGEISASRPRRHRKLKQRRVGIQRTHRTASYVARRIRRARRYRRCKVVVDNELRVIRGDVTVFGPFVVEGELEVNGDVDFNRDLLVHGDVAINRGQGWMTTDVDCEEEAEGPEDVPARARARSLQMLERYGWDHAFQTELSAGPSRCGTSEPTVCGDTIFLKGLTVRNTGKLVIHGKVVVRGKAVVTGDVDFNGQLFMLGDTETVDLQGQGYIDPGKARTTGAIL